MRHSTRNLQHTRLEGNEKRRSLSRRPAVEALEGRALLSAAHDLAVPKHVAVPVPVDKHVAVPVKKIGHKTKLSIVPYFYYPLVSDKNGPPPPLYVDSNLVDPWGINFPQQPGIVPPPEVWVADQGKGVVTMYAITTDGTWITNSPLTVTIPTHGSSTPSGPTGVVQDPTNEFLV